MGMKSSGISRRTFLKRTGAEIAVLGGLEGTVSAIAAEITNHPVGHATFYYHNNRLAAIVFVPINGNYPAIKLDSEMTAIDTDEIKNIDHLIRKIPDGIRKKIDYMKIIEVEINGSLKAIVYTYEVDGLPYATINMDDRALNYITISPPKRSSVTTSP